MDVYQCRLPTCHLLAAAAAAAVFAGVKEADAPWATQVLPAGACRVQGIGAECDMPVRNVWEG